MVILVFRNSKNIRFRRFCRRNKDYYADTNEQSPEIYSHDDSILDFKKSLGRSVQLSDLSFREILLDDVSQSGRAKDNWQR